MSPRRVVLAECMGEDDKLYSFTLALPPGPIEPEFVEYAKRRCAANLDLYAAENGTRLVGDISLSVHEEPA